MDNFRADGPGRGEHSAFAAGGETAAPDRVVIPESSDEPEGDVIRGLRSGLIFSLAIWAMLFGIGTLVFG